MNSKFVHFLVPVFALCALALLAPRPLSAAPPMYDGMPGTTAGQQCVNPKDNAVMVWVPAGNFRMGCADDIKMRSHLRNHNIQFIWMGTGSTRTT